MASNKTSGLPLLIVLLSLGGCSSGDDATPEVQAQKPSLFKALTGVAYAARFKSLATAMLPLNPKDELTIMEAFVALVLLIHNQSGCRLALPSFVTERALPVPVYNCV